MEIDLFDKDFETRIQHLALAFPYPATPPVAGRVISELHGGARRWRPAAMPAWAIALVLILLVFAGLMVVPSVRAAVIEFLQIGAIRIFTEEEIPPLNPSVPTSTRPLPQESETPARFVPLLFTPTPSENEILTSLLFLAGETTLEEAREVASFPILLPTYPSDLGAPDKVFYQRLDEGWGVLLIWLVPEQPDRVKMSLLLLGPDAFAGKGAPYLTVETSVNGKRAVWTEGKHLLVLQTGPNQHDLVQFFVSGNVLIWEVEGITYRLESELMMEEAVRIAESLK
jgi:hypothetical protein